MEIKSHQNIEIHLYDSNISNIGLKFWPQHELHESLESVYLRSALAGFVCDVKHHVMLKIPKHSVLRHCGSLFPPQN